MVKKLKLLKADKDSEIFGLKKDNKRKINQVKYLERKLIRQKQKIAQFEELHKLDSFLLKSRTGEIYSDVSEIINSLEDDLVIEKSGEYGYKNEKEVIKAMKKYTLKVLKRKLNKWEALNKGTLKKS